MQRRAGRRCSVSSNSEAALRLLDGGEPNGELAPFWARILPPRLAKDEWRLPRGLSIWGMRRPTRGRTLAGTFRGVLALITRTEGGDMSAIQFKQTTTATPEQFIAGLTTPGRAAQTTHIRSRGGPTGRLTWTSSSYARVGTSRADCWG